MKLYQILYDDVNRIIVNITVFKNVPLPFLCVIIKILIIIMLMICTYQLLP